MMMQGYAFSATGDGMSATRR